MSFRTARARMGPKWLVEGDGAKIGYALDLIKDAMQERWLHSLIARFPKYAPADALAAIGRDRRVFRGLQESDESYRNRLIRWLDDRKNAGTSIALAERLAEYLGPLPRIRIVDNSGNWLTRDPDGTITRQSLPGSWNWDGNTVAWTRFWVVIYPNGLWTEGQTWNGAGTQAWGDQGHTWGSTATPDEISMLRSIIDDWKPKFARCEKIILAFDSASFTPGSAEPDGTWDKWSKNVAGVQVKNRLQTARYVEGVG